MGCCDLCGNYFDQDDLRRFPMGTSSNVQACPGCASMVLRCAHGDLGANEWDYEPEDEWIARLDFGKGALA